MITVRVPLPLTVTEIHEEGGVPYLEMSLVDFIHFKTNADQAMYGVQEMDATRLEAEDWIVLKAEGQ